MAKGRYQKWLTPEGLLKLEGWARDGLTDEQIAKNIGISRKTLAIWKVKYGDIGDTLKKGKEVVDREVENSLLKRARGTITTSTIYKMVKLDDDVLQVKRQRFLNEYQLDHPELSKQELMMVAIEQVPTYEKIPMQVSENELAPDVSAAIFWLKNRKPEVYRDQSFKELNESQAKKADADTRKAAAEADIAEAKARIMNASTDSTEAKVSEYLDKLDDVLGGDSDGN